MRPVNQTNASNSIKRQFVGMFIGAAAGLAILATFPDLQKTLDTTTILIWCAAVGSALASLTQFERAGAALTHSKNKLLNYLVGLGLPALVLVILTVLLLVLKR